MISKEEKNLVVSWFLSVWDCAQVICNSELELSRQDDWTVRQSDSRTVKK